ncbi:MAG: ABC transporter ATP-binding protein [Gemmataceae bacterium]|nr:ABC transporter ATP-binding protein [Gemmataceae bacterium]
MLLRAASLAKTYYKNKLAVPVLRGVDLDVDEGEFLSVIGASGSGKSTLLHLLGTLDKADSGTIHLDGRRIDNLPARDRDVLRNRTFGFIFQFYHLLPELTALENVLMPLMITYSTLGYWARRGALRKRAEAILDRVGLSHRLKHQPAELSGGEMQRAAIARALISQPRVLLADEPTGNLDTANGQQIMAVLRELNRNDGLTIVMVTHNLDLVHDTDRVVRIADGRIEPEAKIPAPTFDAVGAGK